MKMKISRSEKIGADYCNNFFTPFLLYSYFSGFLGVLSIHRLTSLGKSKAKTKQKKLQRFPMNLYLSILTDFFFSLSLFAKKLQQKTAQIATIPNESLEAFSVKTGVESAPQYKALC